MNPNANPPSPRNLPEESPPDLNAEDEQQTILEHSPTAPAAPAPVPPVVYMISECLQNGQRYHKRQVHNIIFSFLEIFELLRLKTTNKQFKQWVREYFEHLPFLDLSPYFGYTITEQRLLDRSFSNGRSFFQVFQELCPHRTNLSLAYSTQLTCSALKHFLLPDNWSEKLVGLNLYYCTKLKRQDLRELLQTFALDLIDLNISMLHKLFPTDVQYILHALKDLRRISLQGSLKAISVDHPDYQLELDTLEKLESEIQQKTFRNLLFIDCRNCSLLETRDFWQPTSDHDSNNKKLYGIILRGSTWILGPETVRAKDVQQFLCLYPDCGFGNDGTAYDCSKCGRRLFVRDFLQKPSCLQIKQLQEQDFKELEAPIASLDENPAIPPEVS